MMSRTELPEGMAVGFIFDPTDDQLIKSYLEPKLQGRGSEVDHVVAEVDFWKSKPQDLPPKSKIKSNDPMWLFFCKQKLERTEGAWKIVAKKTTDAGTWKITGLETEINEINDQGTTTCIGRKRTLVFKEKPPGQKTKWAMQLYYITPDPPSHDLTTYALCRLKKKADDMPNPLGTEEGQPEQSQPSGVIMSEDEDPVTTAPITHANLERPVIQQLVSRPLYSPGSDFADQETGLSPSAWPARVVSFPEDIVSSTYC